MQSSCPCAHVWSERLAFSCGSSRSLRACPRQARDRHSARVVAFAKSSKRQKYSHSSDKQTRGEPLFVRVEPDGSDIWRLDAIVSLLKSGAVSRCTANSCVLGCLHLSVVIVAAPFGQISAHIAVPHLPIHSSCPAQVGIVPTDSYPAIVCDIDNRQAVERLYTIKGLDPKKQLSILCRHLQDISTYTLGFPVSNQPGQADIFRTARQVLPGPVSLHFVSNIWLCPSCD